MIKTWHRANLYKMILNQLHNQDMMLESMLSFYENEIYSQILRINEIKDQEFGDYQQYVADDTCEHIDMLLGQVYVLCQIKITKTVGMVMSLHRNAKNESSPIELSTTNGKKKEIVQFKRGRILKKHPVAIIDTLANYFKHESEWRTDWNSLRGGAQYTALLLKSIGLSSGCSGNLRTGFAFLAKNCKYNEVLILTDLINLWIKDLSDAYSKELKKLGLLNNTN